MHKIEEFLSTHPHYFRTVESTAAGIDEFWLRKMMRDGLIVKEMQGVYRNAAMEPDLYALYAFAYPYLIYSGETALYLHGLWPKRNVLGEKIHVTVPYDRFNSNLYNLGLAVHHSRWLTVGKMILVDEMGNEVPVYDLERTSIDLRIWIEGTDLQKIEEYKKNMRRPGRPRGSKNKRK